MNYLELNFMQKYSKKAHQILLNKLNNTIKKHNFVSCTIEKIDTLKDLI